MPQLLKYNLQLFAEKEQEIPTEEVESDSDTITEEESVEFEDGSENVPQEKEVEEPKQTETNSNRDNARRRLLEKQKRDQELANARMEGFKEASGNLNKYTNEPLDSPESIEAYKMMLEIEKNGGDPIEDFPKYWIKKQQESRLEQEKENQSKAQRQEQIGNDIADFQKNHPDVDIKSLLKNGSDFLEMYGDLLGLKPLNVLYEKYMSVNTKIEKAKADGAIRQEAIKMSSSGALGRENPPTDKSFTSMTRDEFRAWKEKNIKH